MNRISAIDDPSVESVLAPLRGRPVFFRPLPGNNGDRLIVEGSRFCLARHGLRPVRTPGRAEAIIINGGGAMNDIWSFGLEVLEELSTAFPDTPLIVLPSSFYFSSPRPDFPLIFRDRTAPATLLCRECYSLEILEQLGLPETVRLGLDEDMAFKLRDSDWFADLLKARRQRHVLVVERADPEGATGLAVQHTSNLQRLRRMVPAPLRALADGAVLARRRRRAQRPEAVAQLPTDFARDLVQRVREERPETADLPVYYLDIARLSYCSYDDYCGLIAAAAAVVTTRLHVAILGGMLGKPTYCKSGSYHKMKGVYEHSLAEMDHVTLI